MFSGGHFAAGASHLQSACVCAITPESVVWSTTPNSCPPPPTQALDWRLTSCFTVNNWVNTMMQLGDNVSRCSGLAPLFQNPGMNNHEFVLPKYSGREFIQVMAVSECWLCCTVEPL